MGLKGSHNNVVSGVYSITNTINGMKYIGCSKNIHRRIYGHTNPRRTPNGAMTKAIKEFGVKNFKLTILETGENMFDREMYWIKKLNTKVPNGYNLTEGGLGRKGDTPSLKENKKRSKSLLKYWYDPSNIGKVSGVKNPMFGRRHSEESRKIISDKKRARDKITPPQKASKKTRQKMRDYHKSHRNYASRRNDMMNCSSEKIILCFDNLSIAATWLRENTKYKVAEVSSIIRVCKGKQKTAYGYKWQYNNEGNEQDGK